MNLTSAANRGIICGLPERVAGIESPFVRWRSKPRLTRAVFYGRGVGVSREARRFHRIGLSNRHASITLLKGGGRGSFEPMEAAMSATKTTNPHMQTLRYKSDLISVGSVVTLEQGSEEFHHSAPAGLHTIAQKDGTFFKVIGNEKYVPVERITGVFFAFGRGRS